MKKKYIPIAIIVGLVLLYKGYLYLYGNHDCELPPSYNSISELEKALDMEINFYDFDEFINNGQLVLLKDTSHDLNIHGYSQYNEMYIEISYDKSGWRVRYNFMTAGPFGNIRQDAFKDGMIYQYHYDHESGVIYVAIFEKDKLRIDFSFNNAFYQLDTKTIEEKMIEYIKANEDMINDILERNGAEMLHFVLS